jgi:hypothetical protein
MVILLERLVTAGTAIHGITTVPELQKVQASYKKQAARLRAEAEALWEHGMSVNSGGDCSLEVNKHAKAIKRIAAWCEGQAAHYEAEIGHETYGLVVKRDKGWRREMGLANNVSSTLRFLYGKSCYGITATIVNVITGRVEDRNGRGIVEPTHIRDWLKTLKVRQGGGTPLRINGA